MYEVCGVNGFAGVGAVVPAGSQKSAVEQVLDRSGFLYVKVIKMSTKENNKLIRRGIDPNTMVHFVVRGTDRSGAPQVGSWRVV